MKAILAFVMINFFTFSSAWAQADTQDDLFQKYQAMVIVEEANQHCPLLSRIEAEALNGQIVFADASFSGKLDMGEKFKNTVCEPDEFISPTKSRMIRKFSRSFLAGRSSPSTGTSNSASSCR